jgi:diguanylate cyclase (GGDEF)-like protein
VVIKVLVADDEAIICTLFAAMLGQYGCYEVVTTTDVQAVLPMLRRTAFDVVLLDICMPALPGLEVLRQITQAFEAVPVIVVTGHATVETAVESMQAGAADFVTKPVPASILHLRIQRALEHARTRRLASTDGLTEVYNHRTFQERLAQEIARAERYQRPLSLLMIDIDHFQLYNDMHGYPQGDIVLQDLARLFQEMSRTSDTVARYGGEEFAIILPETDGASAQRIGQRFRECVEQHSFAGEDRMPDGRLTVSVGVATHIAQSRQNALLHAADAALALAKREGRNRVCVADYTLAP